MKQFFQIFISLSSLSQNKKGQSLVEILVAIGFTAILLPALLTGFVSATFGKAQQDQRTQASILLQEAEEVVRIIREKDWTTFAVNGTYHPQLSGSTWLLVLGAETVGGFTRTIAIGDVLRDATGAIVASGGTIDPSTKKIIVSVSWVTPIASSVEAITYITRYVGNTTFTQTTQNDFTDGSANDVIITSTNGGEVTLGAGGQGNWCEPNLSIAALDLPKSGVANGVSAIEGRAFVVTGDNASGVSFADVDISNTNPPVATVAGTFDGYKTNGIFGDTQYAYLATDSNSKEVVIIDLTQQINGKYTEVGYFNAPGNTLGEGIYVTNNIGYVTASNKLYSFDLSSKTGSRPIKDSDGVILPGAGTKVVVVGNYAYVAIAGAAVELQIIDVSDPTNMALLGFTDVNGQSGQGLFVNQTATRAYLVTDAASSEKEFFIIDITTKTGNRPEIGSYEANGMSPSGITVVTGNKAIIVGTGGEEYQVIDITSESAPSRCGGLQVSTGINGVTSVLEADGDAYSYVITGDATSEFKMIAGGPGGRYATSGDFVSSVFDATESATFNRFSAGINQPVGTTIKFQMAVADAVLGSCVGSVYNFVGPDASSSSYFTASSDIIPFGNNGQGYKNPARCFKYKVYFTTTDQTATPILNDMTINYSP